MNSITTPPYRKPECSEWETAAQRMFATSGSLEDFDELDDYTLS
jgi:hypothetical protein